MSKVFDAWTTTDRPEGMNSLCRISSILQFCGLTTKKTSFPQVLLMAYASVRNVQLDLQRPSLAERLDTKPDSESFSVYP